MTVTNTAVEVARPGGYAGEARTYRLDPPVMPLARGGKGYDHVTVSLITRYGLRVECYGAKSSGAAWSMEPIPGSYVLQRVVEMDDAAAWALATMGGYAVVPDPDAPSEYDGLPQLYQ